MHRTQSVTHEVSRGRTGLNGKVYVHVEHFGGRISGIRLSEKGKDGSTLDDLIHALGDVLTDVVIDVQR